MNIIIRSYQQAEGIELNKDNIRTPGFTAVAKLALNSLQGKFGQIANHTKSAYINEGTNFRQSMIPQRNLSQN